MQCLQHPRYFCRGGGEAGQRPIMESRVTSFCNASSPQPFVPWGRSVLRFAAHPTTSIESATGTDLRDGEGDMPALCIQPAVACRLMHAIPIDGPHMEGHTASQRSREKRRGNANARTRESCTGQNKVSAISRRIMHPNADILCELSSEFCQHCTRLPHRTRTVHS